MRLIISNFASSQMRMLSLCILIVVHFYKCILLLFYTVGLNNYNKKI